MCLFDNNLMRHDVFLVNKDVQENVNQECQMNNIDHDKQLAEASVTNTTDEFQANILDDDDDVSTKIFPSDTNSKKTLYGSFSSGEFDEQLISLVQSHPPLYDYRLPTIERTKLKKQDLWSIISNNFGGKTIKNNGLILYTIFIL